MDDESGESILTTGVESSPLRRKENKFDNIRCSIGLIEQTERACCGEWGRVNPITSHLAQAGRSSINQH